MRTALRATLLASLLLSSVPAGAALAGPDDTSKRGFTDAIGDATVIAVMDYAPFSPYHWDLDARHMPQHEDSDPTNDLPLDRPPHEWLPGYPGPNEKGHTFTPIDLTLSHEYPTEKYLEGQTEKTLTRAQLTAADADVWAKGVVKESRYDWRSPRTSDVHLHWFKDTKILGALEFGSLEHAKAPYETSGLNRTAPRTGPDAAQYGSDGHAVGTTSASVGNLHGACPECLLVFLEVDVGGVSPLDTQQTDAPGVEEALSWALDQSWIDAVFMPGTPSATSLTRERLYLDSNVFRQKDASVDGKTIFFSAGNGHEPGAGNGPALTLNSSMQGPDWVVTVSGTHTQQARDQTPNGYGKPADVSGTASVTQTAYDAPEVGGTRSSFSATSLGVSVVAGVYGKALYELRRALPGASRGKHRGEVAVGPRGCATTRPGCELADGAVTADELRRRMLLGATPRSVGPVQRVTVEHDAEGQATDVQQAAAAPGHVELDFASEGFGTYQGRCPHRVTAYRNAGTSRLATTGFGDPCTLLTTEDYRQSDELQDVIGPVLGTRQPKPRRAGEAEWFVVDSWCRQQLWGTWEQGFWTGQQLPPDDAAFPLRTAYRESCAALDRVFPEPDRSK